MGGGLRERAGDTRPYTERTLSVTTYSARFTRSVCGCPRGKHVSERCPWSGSSPRARGTPQATWRLTGDKRFIPAGAGNTSPSDPALSAPAVHPRGRGEHYVRIRKLGDRYGSSPRARGTPPVPGRCRVNLRFIPAGAGNTSVEGRNIARISVHPRGRGEHTPRTSNPRCHRRFIPAGAGNTRGRQRRRPRRSVPPRGRGEHYPTTSGVYRHVGSSPRARGTRS